MQGRRVAATTDLGCLLQLLILIMTVGVSNFVRHLHFVVEDVSLYCIDMPIHQFLVSYLRQRIVSLEIDHLLFNLIQLLRLLLKLCLKCSQFRHVVVVHVGVGAVLLLGLVHLNTSTLSLSAFSGSGLLE